MKNRFLVLVFALSFNISALAAPMGKDSIPLMDAEQLKVLDTLRGLNKNTSANEMSAMFGKPVVERGTQTAWQISNNGKITRVYAYYLTGTMDKLHYISMDPAWGHVIYFDSKGVTHETNNETPVRPSVPLVEKPLK